MNYKMEISIDEMMTMCSVLDERRKECERYYQGSLECNELISADYWRAEMKRVQSIYDKLINAGV